MVLWESQNITKPYIIRSSTRAYSRNNPSKRTLEEGWFGKQQSTSKKKHCCYDEGAVVGAVTV